MQVYFPALLLLMLLMTVVRSAPLRMPAPSRSPLFTSSFLVTYPWS